MKTFQRLKNIVRSQKLTALVPVGGKLMPELQKHLETLDDRIMTIRVGQAIAVTNVDEWRTIIQDIDTKIARSTSEKHLQALSRLKEIAHQNLQDAVRQVESYAGKVDGLDEIRQRTVQAISMLEVENNIRSITAMSGESTNFEYREATLEQETREIRRLLYATDGLMELTS